MFKNAGRKLTTLAKVIFIILCAFAVLMGIGLGVTVGNEVNGAAGFFAFLAYTAAGVLGAWLSTIVLYAFGELCENVKMIREGLGFGSGQLPPPQMSVPMGQPMPMPMAQPDQNMRPAAQMPFGAGGMPPFAAPQQAPVPVPMQGQPQMPTAPVPEQMQQGAAPVTEQVQQGTFPTAEQVPPVIIPAPVEPAPISEPKPEGWQCPNCGKQNPERNAFCTGCGTARPSDPVSLEK